MPLKSAIEDEEGRLRLLLSHTENEKLLKDQFRELGDAVESMECECCGLKEDYTLQYIGRIRDSFCGKWICGLCSEAVREHLKKASHSSAIEEAMETHKAFCQRFHTTTRLHPKLALARAMSDVIKVTFSRRKSCGLNISRSNSCFPRIDVEIDMEEENA